MKLCFSSWNNLLITTKRQVLIWSMSKLTIWQKDQSLMMWKRKV